MLYYETIEKEEHNNWLVLVHGLGGSTLTWNKQKEYFSKNYNLLLLDLHGHGESQNESILTITNYNDVAIKIKEVLDYLSIKTADFMGLSLGTIIVLNYIINYPSTVNKVVLGGCVLNLCKSRLFLLDIVQLVKHILPIKYLYMLFAHILMPYGRHSKSRKIFIRESLKLGSSEMKGWLKSLRELKLSPYYILELNKLKNINMLYIMGSEDHMFIGGITKAVKLLDKASLEIIDKCGHVCSIEKYEDFNIISNKFLME